MFGRESGSHYVVNSTCFFQLDDEKEKEKDAALMEQLERELGDFEDEFLKEYRQKRIEEMRTALNNVYVVLCSFSNNVTQNKKDTKIEGKFCYLIKIN